MYWDERWLALDQEKLYRNCARLAASATSDPVHDRLHHVQSWPYLMATEYPWSCFVQQDLSGRAVLCVAGSGDLPFFFCALGADPVVAVDISLPACYFNELKRAALMKFSWSEFLAFFLSGLTRSSQFLQTRRGSMSLPRQDRLAMYRSLRAELSASALGFWDRHLFENGWEFSPFQGFLRTSDLFFLDRIPYLRDGKTYASWRYRNRRYPLLNLSLELALESSGMSFDMIYASNILEYSRMSFLLEGEENQYQKYLQNFLAAALKALRPNGLLCLYLFQKNSGAYYALPASALAQKSEAWLDVGGCEIEYGSWHIGGSRFRNTLLTLTKAPAAPVEVH